MTGLLKNGGLALLLLVAFFHLEVIVGESITLDLDSDETKEWLQIDCTYNEDYNDFFAFGCPVDLTGDDDIYPTEKGFWTPCTNQQCQLIYFSEKAPVAKSLSFGVYVKGSPQILVSSKYGMLDEEFTEVGPVSLGESEGWFDAQIDIADKAPRARILKITVTSSEDDLILLNKVTIDLGDGVSLPPEIPPTTTVVPIENSVITLNTNKDYWVIWQTEGCVYQDDPANFWPYGCGLDEGASSSGSSGFWQPCNAKSCELRYSATFTTVDAFPKSLNINSYLAGSAQMIVSTQPIPDGPITLAAAINSTEDPGWKENDISIDAVTPVTIKIELMKGSNGIAVLDEVKITLKPRTNGDGDGGNDAGNKSGSSKLSIFPPIELLCLLLLTISSCLVVKMQ